jgi:predicted transcriptional regulator
MRRTNLDICADLLYVAKGGAKKTHLVYQANLNFALVKKYLSRLTENGLLEPVNGSFFTTDKGSRFLDQYEIMKPMSEIHA